MIYSNKKPLNKAFIYMEDLMKDKRYYLKLACALESSYIIVMVIYNLFFTKIGDKQIVNLFFYVISIICTIVMYKESRHDIKYLKDNNIKILISSIYMFIDSIIPGILGFMFLSSLKEKKKLNLPDIKEENTKKDFFKGVITVVIFIFLMFIMPNFKFFTRINTFIIYAFILLFTLLMWRNNLLSDFNIFKNNKKVYFKFIVKRYLIMIGVMILVGIPVVLLNNGKSSINQQEVNLLFKQSPILTLLLTSFYAPLVEETTFRLSIKKIFNNKYLFIIISGVLFGLLHVVSNYTNIYNMLFIFQYSALGICLAKAYYDSKNIWVSISMHFIQNFMSSILILLFYM